MYQTNCLFTVEHSPVERTVFSDFYKLAIAIFRPVISLEACDFTGIKCERCGTSAKINFFASK